ncbi:MAG: DUF971 domain-containing protein [Methylobacterium sp.]|nr:DUF971 domain-containing protein [Methylobacterium sp.]
MTDNTAWPTELRVAQDRKSLIVAFDDGYSGEISAELLRVRSPSAEVQGHSPSERKTVPGKIHVMILGVEPVGNYAIRIRFDDMHDSGIYGWPLLRHFASQGEAVMAEYEAELSEKGLSREPKFPARR